MKQTQTQTSNNVSNIESAAKIFNLDSIDTENFTAEELKYVKEQAAKWKAKAQYKLYLMKQPDGIYYLMLSAMQGYREALHEFGVITAKDDGIGVNNEMVYSMISKAAKQGYASAQHLLGYMYLNGTGISVNCNKALHWFRKAAKQDDEDAKFYAETISRFAGGRDSQILQAARVMYIIENRKKLAA